MKAWLKENRPEAKKAGVVTIGPAGENQVAFAVIENDYWRSAGRTGVGAVLGAKKIKAIAFWGNRSKEIADLLNLSPKTVEVRRRNIRRKVGLRRTPSDLRAGLLARRTPRSPT